MVIWVHGYLYRLFYAEVMCEIGGLVFEKDYRKMGIGRGLIESVENWAREKECSKVSLRSSSSRKKAHQFYKI